VERRQNQKRNRSRITIKVSSKGKGVERDALCFQIERGKKELRGRQDLKRTQRRRALKRRTDTMGGAFGSVCWGKSGKLGSGNDLASSRRGKVQKVVENLQHSGKPSWGRKIR